jgi:hypothetical protein
MADTACGTAEAVTQGEIGHARDPRISSIPHIEGANDEVSIGDTSQLNERYSSVTRYIPDARIIVIPSRQHTRHQARERPLRAK